MRANYGVKVTLYGEVLHLSYLVQDLLRLVNIGRDDERIRLQILSIQKQASKVRKGQKCLLRGTVS